MNNTEICNMALSFVAKGKITSLDESTEEAKQCSIHYDHCRRRLLRAYTWGFAKRVVQLALLNDTMPGYKYLYAYPAECLSVRFVYDDETAKLKDEKRQEYDIMLYSGNQRVIATDVENAYAEYTYDIKDTDMFSEEFTDALVHLLASSVAFALTGNASVQQTQFQLAQAAIDTAKWQTAIEQERDTKYPKTYSEARFR